MSSGHSDLTVCNTPVLAHGTLIKKYCYRLQKEVFRNIKYDNLLVDFSIAIAATTSNHAAKKIRQAGV